MPIETENWIALALADSDEALVAVGGGEASGIRAVDVLTGEAVAEFPGALNRPRAFSPDGAVLVASGVEDGAVRLAAVTVADGRELWSLTNVSAQDFVGFAPDGSTLFVTTGPYAGNPNARGPELIAIDTATGEELASRPLRSGAYGGVTVSPSGSMIAVFEDGADDVGAWVYLFDVIALLAGEDALVAETELAGGTAPLGVAFSEDESTLYVPDGEILGGGLLALAVDDGLEIRWSIDTGGVLVEPVIADGLLWFPSQTPDENGVPRFDLVGIPTDVGEYAAWAAKVPQREFTEAECRRYLDGPCADVVSNLSG